MQSLKMPTSCTSRRATRAMSIWGSRKEMHQRFGCEVLPRPEAVTLVGICDKGLESMLPEIPLNEVCLVPNCSLVASGAEEDFELRIGALAAGKIRLEEDGRAEE